MSSKTTTTTRTERTRRRALNELKRIRDEIRLKLHLGGMDARVAWTDLEPQIERLDKALTEAGAHVGHELDGAIAAVKQAAESLRARLMAQSNHAGGH